MRAAAAAGHVTVHHVVYLRRRQPISAPQARAYMAISQLSSFVFYFQLSLFRSFLVFFVLIAGFYLSHNRLFLDSFCVLHKSASISVSLISHPFKTFSGLFSLCAGLNEQLACQFSSANHASYYIISHHGVWGIWSILQLPIIKIENMSAPCRHILRPSTQTFAALTLTLIF